MENPPALVGRVDLSIGDFNFGASGQEAIAALTRTLGAPRSNERVAECDGSGRATTMADFGPLVIYIQDDRFAGWEQRDSSETPWIGTPSGAAVGIRRPALQDAIEGLRVEQSSLGTEFSGNGISGLLAADRADAQVDRMWAGTNCAMR